MNTIVYQNGRTINFRIIADHSHKKRLFEVDLGKGVAEELAEYVVLEFDLGRCNCHQFGVLCELVATVGC